MPGPYRCTILNVYNSSVPLPNYNDACIRDFTSILHALKKSGSSMLPQLTKSDGAYEGSLIHLSRWKLPERPSSDLSMFERLSLNSNGIIDRPSR